MNRILLAVFVFVLASPVFAGILPSPNPNRAYPPSCIPGDLPTQPTGIIRDHYVTLATIPQAGGLPAYEQVYVGFWRVACSPTKSALLMKVKRVGTNYGRSDLWVRPPFLRFSQGNITARDATGRDLVRYAEEPNTRVSDVGFGGSVITEATYVIEHRPDAPIALDFNQAFGVSVSQSAGDAGGYQIDVPAYVPTPATYPNAFLPQVISGYHAALYIQPSNPGRSLSVSIYELPDPNIKEVFVNWNFQDATGKWWFLGQGGGITAGDRRANIIQLMYNDGAGYFRWGNATLEWDDCNTIHFTATPYPNLAAGVPNQPVSETWTRIAPFNALACE